MKYSFWGWTSIGGDSFKICHTCANFDKNTIKSLIPVKFTKLFPYLSIVTLTFRIDPSNVGHICAVVDISV